MRKVLTLLTLAAALVAAAVPARGAMPAFAGYFAGTWTCTTAAGAHVMKTYGASETGNELLLFNTYVTSSGRVQLISDAYAQHGDTVSDISHALGSSAIYVGTSPGFVGDRLVFTGTMTTANAVIYELATIVRSDATHFKRTFENARSADGPFTTVSSEDCTRVAAAPVPSPPAHP